MITKRLFSIIFAMPMAVSSFADSGLSGLSDAADGVGSYLPYVQGVCYVIAAVIAVAGAMSIYLSMQTNPNQIWKRMMMTVGSCMCFVLMATALPQFFGVDGSVLPQEEAAVHLQVAEIQMGSLPLTKEESHRLASTRKYHPSMTKLETGLHSLQKRI